MIRLLVSVRSADEALVAARGGVDFIDAKEPSRGALGALVFAFFFARGSRSSGWRMTTAWMGTASALSARLTSTSTSVGMASTISSSSTWKKSADSR